MANESWLDDLLGYKTVSTDGDSGGDMPPRARLLFSGGVTVTDDPERRETVVHIPSAGGGGGGSAVGLLAPIRLASLVDLPLSGLVDVDGTPTVAGDRIGAFGQTDPAERGVYVASELGWARAPDLDQSAELVGATLVPVREGASLHDQVFILASDEPLTIGTSPLEFTLIGSGDAARLRGRQLDDSVAAPDVGAVLQTDGTLYTSGLITNANVDPAAAIAVSKLKSGTNGQVLRSQGGAVAWSQLSVGDLGESLISPDVLATDQNNYAPGGWGTATVVRLAADAPRTIRGLQSGASVRVARKLLINVSPHILTLAHDDGGQAAGNRILTPRQPFELRPGQGATVVYDSAQSVWRAIDAQAPQVVAGIPTFFPDPVTFAADVRMRSALRVYPEGYLGRINGYLETGLVDAWTVKALAYGYPLGVQSKLMLPLKSFTLQRYNQTQGWFEVSDGALACPEEPRATCHASFRIPGNGTLSGVRIGVTQSNAGHPYNMEAYVRLLSDNTDMAPGSPYVVTEYSDVPIGPVGGTTGYYYLERQDISQFIGVTGLDKRYELRIRASDAPGEGVTTKIQKADFVHWVELTFTANALVPALG